MKMRTIPSYFLLSDALLMSILLTTLNARFAHASLGLRYLSANMGSLRSQTEICEFTIQQNISDILETIVTKSPKIIGMGIYIWNIIESTTLIKELKVLRPEIKIILGGPEISYEYTDTEIFKYADHLITGWGDISFPKLCHDLLNIQKINSEHPDGQNLATIPKVIEGIQAKLTDIVLPYTEYSDADLKQRTIYVEASRGCPFKCEFCLSSLDKTAWSFPLESFMAQMDVLYTKGLRQYKFVDRTFNLKKEFTSTILNFFLDKIALNPTEMLFLHFELVPDYLSDDLKALILKFPEGTLQFEIGIQTLHLETQKLISRKTDLKKAKENIQWLSQKTAVHLHVDLIAGLPAENWQQFAAGFNELWSWQPHEIQLGILKRLKGTPIIRHTPTYAIKYSLAPPYTILENNALSFHEINEIKRIAKYWDLLANSGRFNTVLPILLGTMPFENMHEFSIWLYQNTNQTHSIALDRLFNLVFDYLVMVKKHPLEVIQNKMSDDFKRIGIQGWPKILGPQPDDWKTRFKTGLKQRPNPTGNISNTPELLSDKESVAITKALPKRQAQHQ